MRYSGARKHADILCPVTAGIRHKAFQQSPVSFRNDFSDPEVNETKFE